MLGSKQRTAIRGSNALTTAIARGFKGGLNTYDPALTMPSQFITEGVNVYPDANGTLRVRFGTTRFAHLSQTANIVAMEYYLAHLVCVLSDGTIVAVNSDGVPEVIWSDAIAATRPGTPTGWSDTTFVSFAQFNGKLIVCNGVDKPLIVDEQVEVNYLADIATGSNVHVPRARYVVTHQGYLVMARTPTNSTTLYISSKGTSGTFDGDPEPNDATNFDTGVFTTRGVAEITGLGSFRDRLIVTYDECVMTVKLGGADGDAHVPEVTDIVENYGAVSHRAIVPMGDDLLFMDKVGLASVARALVTATLSPTRESLLVSRDMQKLLARFSAEELSTGVWALHDRIASQVLFFIPKEIGSKAQLGIGDVFDPASKGAGLVLSNGDKTVTANNPVGNQLVRTKLTKYDGKYYFEFRLGAFSGNESVVGAVSTPASAGWWSNGVSGFMMSRGGGLWSNQGIGPGGFGAIQNRTVAFAVDMNIRRVWARVMDHNGANASNWNMSPTANPATGAGGHAIGVTAAMHVAVGINHAELDDTATLQLDATEWAGTAPTGYGVWGETVPDIPETVATADNDVYVFCVDKTQRFRAMAYFTDMPYRCGCRTGDGRLFVAAGQRIWYYRNQYEPAHVDDGRAGTQPWADDSLWTDNSGWVDVGVNGTFDGDAINFAISTPWSDMRSPENVKEGRYLHCVMEGAGDVTIEQYNDRFETAQLSLEFKHSALPAEAGMYLRPLNNDQLYAWNSRFTRARLRLRGSTKQALGLLSLGLLYLPGGYRR